VPTSTGRWSTSPTGAPWSPIRSVSPSGWTRRTRRAVGGHPAAAEADPAANCGAIGSTIGHEITHAFDSEERKSNSTGALRDWWAPADAKRYKEQAEALVRQYDGYEPFPGEHIDGVLTLAENIADLAGPGGGLRRVPAVVARQ
jgi:hypothetical protein